MRSALRWVSSSPDERRRYRLSDCDQPGHPAGAGSRVPQREHSTERVPDDRRLVEPKRVEDVVDQLPGAMTDLTASITIRARQPVAGKIDREYSPW
jgi:hypothetical protein